MRINKQAMQEKQQSLFEDELKLIYDEIILYYEREVIPNPKGFRKNDARFTNYIQLLNAEFHCIDNASTISIPNSYKTSKETFFIFKPVTKNNHKLSSLASLLAHLRNCFSHGHFSKESVSRRTTMLCLEDRYTTGKKKGQLSMIAQLPLDQLKLLIQIIKLCKK